MKIKIINKIIGYFVGFGGLTKKEIEIVAKLNLPNGTYKITGIIGYVGIWTDNEGKVDIEKSRWFADFTTAYKWGKVRKQKAIWDCENQQEIWLIKQRGKKLKKHIKNKQFEYWIYED